MTNAPASLSVSFEDVVSAAERLRGVAHRTPVLTSRTLNERVGAEVFCKSECFQRVGAFKFRGGYNAMSRLSEEERARGVLTYSSGNHAQAVALAGRELGVRAVIVMPTDAPGIKLAATRGYGAEVVTYERSEVTREELGDRIATERGLTIIPPYDHPHVIAGQGTAAMELIEDAGPFDLVFACCGGGGLLSGTAIATRAMCPDARVVGVEPETADDATRSWKTGQLHHVRDPHTIADGVRTPSLGEHTFPIVRALVDDMVTVSEREIARETLLAMERMKVVVEPSGALGLAGLARVARERPDQIRGKRIGVIISGGNLDLTRLPGIRTLAALGDGEGP